MGYSLGFDDDWKRWVGYGVPAYCDHPGCTNEIDRGLSYICGGDLYGGEHGCGLFFCSEHLYIPKKKGLPFVCDRCWKGKEPFEPKPEHPRWIKHLLTDKSWKQWRKENPDAVKNLKAASCV